MTPYFVVDAHTYWPTEGRSLAEGLTSCPIVESAKMHHLAILSLLALAVAGCSQEIEIASLDADIAGLVGEYPEATVAVSIRDPSTRTDFDREAERLFHAASTMKVPVMIEVFRRARRGDFSLDDSLLVVNRLRPGE